MLAFASSVRVYLASESVDMRRGHDGLFAIVKSWGMDPFSGDLYCFVGKRRDRVKILVWHRGGFLLLYNSPSSHYTSFNSRRGFSFWLRDARRAAARSLTRSQRLECFLGCAAGSS